MSESMVTQAERNRLYYDLSEWIAPRVPAIRMALQKLGIEDTLEANLDAFKASMIAAMEQLVKGAGLEEEARSHGFLATWDRHTESTPGERWFPQAEFRITTDPPSQLQSAVPLIKSALDYLLAGMRANQEAVLSNRPDFEVLDGAGRVMSRTRRVKA